MSLVDFSAVKKLFGGSDVSAEEQEALFKECLLLTLSRATSADSNIDPAEVDTVQAIIRSLTGETIDSADIRVAAASALYESAPLPDYLKKAGKALDVRQCVTITKGLAEIIRSDDGVRNAEVEFFNMVAGALNITPAQIAGLIPNQP